MRKAGIIIPWLVAAAALGGLTWALWTRSPCRVAQSVQDPATGEILSPPAEVLRLRGQLEELRQELVRATAASTQRPLPIEAAPAPAAPIPSPAATESGPLPAAQKDARALEADRLKRRLASASDPNERAILVKLEEKLAALEEIQTRMLQASTPEEKRKLTESLLPLMGEVIQLNRADRQYRMTELARSLGLSDANAVRRFMGDVETIYRETQRDLAPFFSQGGPYHPSAPEPYRTEPIPVVGPGQPPQ